MYIHTHTHAVSALEYYSITFLLRWTTMFIRDFGYSSSTLQRYSKTETESAQRVAYCKTLAIDHLPCTRKRPQTKNWFSFFLSYGNIFQKGFCLPKRSYGNIINYFWFRNLLVQLSLLWVWTFEFPLFAIPWWLVRLIRNVNFAL